MLTKKTKNKLGQFAYTIFTLIVTMAVVLSVVKLASTVKMPLSCLKQVDVSTAGSTSIYTVQELSMSDCE